VYGAVWRDVFAVAAAGTQLAAARRDIVQAGWRRARMLAALLSLLILLKCWGMWFPAALQLFAAICCSNSKSTVKTGQGRVGAAASKCVQA
jgi:hypothetical protein